MKKWIFILTLAVLLGLCIFCAWYTVTYVFEQDQAGSLYDTLAKDARASDKPEPGQDEPIPSGMAVNGDSGSDVDINKVVLKNPDTIGWLRIRGTHIDYPIMQSKSPEFYLKRDFNRQTSKYGTPFLDERCGQDSDNWIVYGHAMKDGTMFADLQKFKSSEFCSETEITLTSVQPQKTGKYQVFAVLWTDTGNDIYQFVEAGDEQYFNDYIRCITENSLYQTKELPQYWDELMTLVTCDNDRTDGRIVVVAYKSNK